MPAPRRSLVVFTVGAAAALVYAVAPQAAHAQGLDVRHMPVIQHRILSGAAAMVLDGGLDERNSDASVSTAPRNYYPADTNGCPVNRESNVKVNQNCVNLSDPDLQGRGQAQNETSIAQDPNNPNNLIASQNDYRRGDGNCYGAYSRNGGRTWDDSTVPMSFTRGTAFGNNLRQYWQSGGDTSVAFDTRGNSYLSCQVFNRGAAVSQNPDTSSAFYVFRSTGNHGASWSFPGRPVTEQNAGTGAALPFLDKQLLTVDNHVASPHRDRVYITYTNFNTDGTAYIYESYSADYGEHFSAPVLVSKTTALCPNTFGLPTPRGNCNENQFSQPFTGANGDLYVTWANFNNAQSGPKDNHNQMLLARSTNGGASFSAPVKVSDYYDLPDCATYQGGQDPGRACVPEKGSTQNSVFRATNYPSGAVNPANGDVVVTFGSYLNQHSNENNGCVPQGVSTTTGQDLYKGVKQYGACNNDILISVSHNRAGSFTGTTINPRRLPTVNTAPGQNVSDQFWQWLAISNSGKVASSYYDRQYDRAERVGNSDVSLSGTRDYRTFKVTRVTSASMPPPTQFSGTFLGDYSGLSADDGTAHPDWMDTRDVELFLCPGTGTAGHPPSVCRATEAGPQAGLQANDQNIYTAAVRNYTP